MNMSGYFDSWIVHLLLWGKFDSSGGQMGAVEIPTIDGGDGSIGIKLTPLIRIMAEIERGEPVRFAEAKDRKSLALMVEWRWGDGGGKHGDLAIAAAVDDGEKENKDRD